MKIRDLPKEIEELALKRQEEQGNRPNGEVMLSEYRGSGGFTWYDTPEGTYFWGQINAGNFDVFYEKYPSYDNPTTKKVDVEDPFKDNEVYHCETEEDAKQLLIIADSFGYKWVSGSSFLGETFHHVFGEKTAYDIVGGTYTNLDRANDDNEVIIDAKEIINKYKNKNYETNRIVDTKSRKKRQGRVVSSSRRRQVASTSRPVGNATNGKRKRARIETVKIRKRAVYS